jgi:hypothetical protein
LIQIRRSLVWKIYYSKCDRDRFPFFSRIIAPTKFPPLFRLNSLSAHSFLDTKLMSNEQIVRITANILSFQPYVINKHNLWSDPYQILSSIYCKAIKSAKHWARPRFNVQNIIFNKRFLLFLTYTVTIQWLYLVTIHIHYTWLYTFTYTLKHPIDICEFLNKSRFAMHWCCTSY